MQDDAEAPRVRAFTQRMRAGGMSTTAASTKGDGPHLRRSSLLSPPQPPKMLFESLTGLSLPALPRWATLLLLSVAAYSIATRVWQWRRLRHIPGPATAGFSGFWLLRLTWKGGLFEGLGQACKEYGTRNSDPTLDQRYLANNVATGPVVRIAPNFVVCGDPSEIRRLWHHRSGWDRSVWFKGLQLDPPRDFSLSMRDNERHTALRAKLAQGVRCSAYQRESTEGEADAGAVFGEGRRGVA